MSSGLVAALVVVLAGCRLDVVADVTLEADGTGTVGVVFHLDEGLLDELDAVGVDPTAELEAAALDADDWELERTSDGRDLTLTLERPVGDPDELGEALRELTSGLAPEDPALLVDIEVVLDDDGSSHLDGVTSFRPPATAGATLDGEPIGPSAQELQELVERAVAPVLLVTLPGRVERHDADELDGRTLRWEVPVASERSVTAQAAPAPWWTVHALWLAAAGGALLLVVLLLVWWLRRRRRRRAPTGAWT